MDDRELDKRLKNIESMLFVICFDRGLIDEEGNLISYDELIKQEQKEEENNESEDFEDNEEILEPKVFKDIDKKQELIKKGTKFKERE